MDQILVLFSGYFWSILGYLLGSVLGLEWAKMRQDDSNEGLMNLKVPKCSVFNKCDFTMRKPYFRVLEAFKTSMRGSGRLSRGT